MSSNLAILVYTHSEYSFLWEIMITLLQRYVHDVDIHWLYDDTCHDSTSKKIPFNFIRHTYNSDLIWSYRVGACLNNIKNEYILFLHEDWIPIDNINNGILNELTSFMKVEKCSFLLSYTHYSVVLNGSYKRIKYKDDVYIFDISSHGHVFQPAIWDKKTFIEFCKLAKTKNQNEDAECLSFMRTKKCLSTGSIDPNLIKSITTRSVFFPHMHILSQGLWNFKKYPTLKCLLECFNIDTTTRGVHSWWEIDTH
jgi:hypothetical protein